MTTSRVVVTRADGWVQVATAEEDFLVENIGGSDAQVTLQSAAPGADAAFHRVRHGSAFVRVGTGACYVAADDSAKIVVSK